MAESSFYDLLTEDYSGQNNIVMDEVIEIKEGEFDSRADGCLSLKGLLQTVQLNAFHHHYCANADVQDLIDSGMLLFVIRLTYKINRMPKIGESLRYRTWVYYDRRRGVLRYNTIETLSGELLSETTSRWVVVDAETRTMVPVETFNKRWDYQFPKMSFCPSPKTFKKQCELTEDYSFKITDKFIDMNGHVNNCEYAGFVDMAMEKLGETREPTALEISFNAEARLGDEIKMEMGRNDSELFVDAQVSAHTCFRAKVLFSEVDDAEIFF